MASPTLDPGATLRPDAGAVPLVTIAIPTYNRATSLRRALASALAQDHPRVEVVVCDNASTDDTPAVVAELCAGRNDVVVLRVDENIGALRNFERALAAASGELFMWLADDDWIEDDYVSRCVEQLRTRPGSILVHADAHYYGDDGTVFVERADDFLQASPRRRVLAYYRRVAGNGTFYGVSTTVARRRAPALTDDLATDWVHVAALAATGTIVAAPTAIHRAAVGSGAGCGLSTWQYAWTIARHVRWTIADGTAFASDSPSVRHLTALAAAVVVLWQLTARRLFVRRFLRGTSLLQERLRPETYERVRAAYRRLPGIRGTTGTVRRP